MKLKKFALMLMLVMVLASCESAFAWGNRTGSRTGDAAVYGVAGGVIAGGVAYWLAGAATVLCPPVGIAAGLGLLGAGAYGALREEKSIVGDAVTVVAAPVVAGLAAVKAPDVARWLFKIEAEAVVTIPILIAAQAIADDWKKPDPSKPVNVADIPY
ncbi:MAG: hypothetical protein IJG37_03495 [Synergistaceae bacterium]|nr:hypothetical protein [Synergistaceae bacterium]MBQ7169211.1 hypothetical protein [Synergistaceae bacterium]